MFVFKVVNRKLVSCIFTGLRAAFCFVSAFIPLNPNVIVKASLKKFKTEARMQEVGLKKIDSISTKKLMTCRKWMTSVASTMFCCMITAQGFNFAEYLPCNA